MESFEAVNTLLFCLQNRIIPLYLLFCFAIVWLHLLEEVESGHHNPECVINN